jgi:single-stranded-DNA-specific exonuclease
MQLSVTGRQWHHKQQDERSVLNLMQKHHLSEIVAKVLLNRLPEYQTVDDTLAPTLKNMLPNPSVLLDMDNAISRTVIALKAQQKIAVYADYDVDGATSSALLRRYFNDLGLETTLYIPDRIDEGYGANKAALQKLRDDGIDLVVMTDCGTTSFDPLAHAKEIGLDVIVLDHHTAEAKLPDAVAIVNPNRLDQDLTKHPDLSHLCAAGVSYMFLIALQRELKNIGLSNFPHLSQTFPDLIMLLDIVALGTVCDVMPLTGLNRALVSQGLKVFQKRQNLGLTALSDIAAITEKISTYHLGFALGPRINAGGRVGKADLGSRLLTTKNPAEAQQISRALDFYNKDRQEIEKAVLDEAIGIVESEKLYENPIIMVGAENWHPGVIGIVSGRIKEKYQKPAIVVSFDSNGEGKGSGRSVSGVELGAAMHVAVHDGLLLKGGGHAMAAGLSVAREKYEEFYQFLNNKFKTVMDAYIPTIYIDGSLPLAAVTTDFAKSLDILEPFGNGNPSPKFSVNNVKVVSTTTMGADHLRVTLQDNNFKKMQVVAFRCIGTPIGDALSDINTMVSITGSIKHNVWNGREQVSFIVDDVMRAE